MPDGYSSSAARKAAHVSQRCLDYWNELGIVSPSVGKAHGKGTDRLYSFEDIVKLRVVRNLRELGLSLQKIQEALRKLPRKTATKDALRDEVLVTDGQTVSRRLESGQLADVLAEGQLVLNIIRVGLIRQETETSIVQLDDRLDERQAGQKGAGPRRSRQPGSRTASSGG
jgi:DNA-binding transcriptional MerR regulator